MNVLLVSPHYNYPKRFEETPAQSLLLLGTLAQQRGHKARVLHLDVDEADFVEEFKRFKPDIVGITVDTFQTKSAKEVSAQVKSISKDTLVVIGGPHPSSLRDKCFEDFPNVDVVVYGEGETAFMSILDGISFKSIPNVCTKEYPSTSELFIEPLDQLPMLDYSLVDIKRFSGAYPIRVLPALTIMTSRGCPFHCTFCNKSVLGHKTRFRDPLDVVEEIQWYVRKYHAREICFNDDTFNLDVERAMRMWELIIRRNLNKKVCFRCACRVNEKLLPEEFLVTAAKANVWFVFYGVESGSPEVLRRMRKEITVPECVRAFDLTHKQEIKTTASFIVGMPGETRQTLEETARVKKELHSEYSGWAYACPFPATDLDREVTEKGHKRSMSYDAYGYGLCIVRTDELDYDDLLDFGGFGDDGKVIWKERSLV